MTIHVYTICWNEEGMLPHFLRHYTSFCDQVFVYDNFSTDRSPSICLSHANVTLRQYDSGGQIRDDLYLSVKNNVWKRSRGKADWVIVCDIDEFLYAPDLRKLLEQLNQSEETLVRCKGFNMVSTHYPTEQEVIFETIREGVRSTSFDKVLLFRPDEIDEINFGPGAHSCNPIGSINYSDLDVKLLHYKYLSLDYNLQRYRLMASRLSDYNKKFHFGIHYGYSSRKIKREFNEIWAKRSSVL